MCGEQLEDASWGLYAWGMPELLGQPFPYGEPLDFYTVHKPGYRRDCLGELETTLGRENVLSEELRYLPICLARNLGMEIDG